MKKRFLSILLILALAVTLTGCTQKQEPTAKETYDQAVALLQTGNYKDASTAFTGMGHFLDAPKYTMYCDAVLAAESGNYSVATTAFAALGDFLDSKLLAVYYAGRDYESSEAYELAMVEYNSIPLYADASDRAAQMSGKVLERDYKAAVKLQENKQYNSAIVAFEALDGYSDSVARIAAIRQQMEADAANALAAETAEAYSAAVKLEKEGKLYEAECAFRALGSYEDSAERANSIKYQRASKAEKEDDVLSAYSMFSELGEYEDSVAKAEALREEATYLAAFDDAEAGHYTQAQNAYASLGSYKDSSEKARLLGVFALSDSSKMLNSGVYAFKMEGYWGYVDLNKNLDVSPRWDDIGAFNNKGISIVKSTSAWSDTSYYGLINANGKILLDPNYLEICSGDNSMFTAVDKSSNTYYFTLVSAEGKALSTWQTLGQSYNTNPGSKYGDYYAYGPSFTNGMIFAENRNGTWSMLNTEGIEMISGAQSLQFTSRNTTNDSVIVGSKHGYQVYNLDGTPVNELVWESISPFSEGYAIVSNSNGLYGYIEKDKCEVAIEPQYKDAMAFSEGYAGVKSDDGWGFINTRGEITIQPIYYSVSPFRNGYSTVAKYDVGYQVIDINGSLVYFKENAYQYANSLDEAGYYEAAIAEFEALNGYADSDARALQARDKINEQVYARAIELENAGKLAEAAEAFEWLGEYSDSATRAANARETINANAYAAAAALEEAGKLEEAIVAFNELGDYRGSAAHAIEIRETINRNIYQAAVDLDDAGKYEEAIAIFSTIADYNDVSERIAASEEKIRVRDYNAAAALEEAGQFEEAIVAFTAMNGYSDSNERILAIQEKIRVRDYNAAAALEEAGQFEEAIIAFTTMNGYSDSNERILAIQEKIRVRDYNAAAALEEAGQFEEAIVAFAAMNGYSDSDDRISAIQEKIRDRDYNAAATLEEAGNFSDAYAAFIALGDYKDSAARAEGVAAKAIEQQNQTAYAAADAAEQSNELETAEAAFIALGDYNDSATRAAAVQEKIRQRDYAAGVAHLNNEEYAEAVGIFTALETYKDSASLLAQAQTGVRYQAAVTNALAGKLTEAYNEFVALGDYKDCAKKAEIVGNLSRAGKTKQITDGVLIYEFHELWGIANLNTNAIAPVKYTSIEYEKGSKYSSYNLLLVYLKGDDDNDCYGYIDMNGKEIIECRYIKVTDFNSEGNCTVAKWVGKKSRWNEYYLNFLFGIRDHSGFTITEPCWRTMGRSQNKDWGKSRYSLYSSYCEISSPTFTNGKMKVQNADGNWGYIDSNGKVLGSVKWSSIGDFSDGMAQVAEMQTVGSGYNAKTVTRYGFINEQGQTIGEVRWDKVNAFSNGYAAVQENGKWGFINKYNELVIPCQYVEVNAFKADGTCDVKTASGTWQVIDTTGNVSFFGK